MRTNCSGILKLVVLLALTSCASTKDDSSSARLNQLPAFDQDAFAQPTAVTETALDALYQQILKLAPQPEMRQKILYRLSQLHTQQLERQELAIADERAALQVLIANYQQLLQQYPDDPNNELLRYQLARSYDLLAQPEASLQQLSLLLAQYPDSSFAAEAWFRKADIHYSRGDYELALAAYLQVLAAKQPSLQQHARYMAGWSYFKLQRFNLADQQFLQLLDNSYNQLLVADQQQSLRQEVFNILSISLSYQHQAFSLQQLLQQVPYASGERPIRLVAQLYQSLADFLLEKGFVDKSLASYRLFITDYADTYTAAEFQLNLIQHYLAHGDAVAALQAQQDYINLFNPDSAFWQRASPKDINQVIPQLLQYLNYFARAHYTDALAGQGELKQQAFASAIPYWQQMLKVFATSGTKQPSYNSTDIRYLLAESYAGNEQLELAFKLYVELGYTALTEQASIFTSQDAAYKALLLAEKLALAADGQSAHAAALQQRWREQQWDFVQQHPQHPAAQQVALQQLQQDYSAQRYSKVLQQADNVINWPLATEKSSQFATEALFLRSQAELTLAHYAAAELSLQQLLKLPITTARKRVITEQLASSIYQQAQQPAITNLAAIEHLQRLLQLLPDSSFHEAAAFQQISLFIAEADWPVVPGLLQSFIARYPDSERTAAANAQLIQSYQQLEQWQLAAEQLRKLSANTVDPEQQREALWLAAEYYLQAEQLDLARRAFRDYANQYPQPHAIAQEARQHLVQLYQQQNDLYRKNFWLAKIVSFEQASLTNQANSSTARTQQLAATAALSLGQHENQLFSQVTLRHPLQANLTKKRQHLQAAIGHYQQSLAYGVATNLAQAQFSIGQLYEDMAQALLSSERPEGLTALAAEQYDLLLEEQAYPFEELAIELYRQTTALIQQQLYDSWVKQSFARLKVLLPAEFAKDEAYLEIADEPH
jgi:cellulose synthase operon protein C